MKQKMTLIASNSEAFPAGSRAWAEEAHGRLTILAGYEVEDVTYSRPHRRVDVRTALGYQFTISADDYDRLIVI
jgi:hypothetical protein